MRNSSELCELKNIPMSPFENAYAFLIFDLQNDLISKSDGMERVKHKLSEWDKEAREAIKIAVLEEFEGENDFVLNNVDLLREFAEI